MKTNQILTALNLSNSKYFRDHASKLALIYDHIKSISQQIVSVEIKELFNDGDFSQIEGRLFCAGEKLLCNQFTIQTLTGSFICAIPKNNDFYNAFCALIPSHLYSMQLTPMQNTPAQNDLIADVLINMPSEVLNECKTALKFVGKDELRPQMQCVFLDFNNGKLNIVATDAHKLYKSESFEVDNPEPMQISIPSNVMKQIIDKGFKNLVIEVIYKTNAIDNKNQQINEVDFYIANGVKFEPVEGRYPNYNAVIPELTTFMEFDKNEFQNKLAIVSKCANKVTKCVAFHLNGSIEMTANDYDFNQYSNANMAYVNKNFKDADIGFNYSFLLEGLKVFKGKTVKLYSEGDAKRAGVLKEANNDSLVLIMPVMLTAE
jgi:DNA polymerase III sliding clamp (beta) subunit (PCNA family)